MTDREELVGNIMTLMPSMFKKFMKQMPEIEIPKQQFGLLHAVCIHEGKTMSCYSDKMAIPKSNISVLAEKLIKDGYIIRELDADDRRVINLKPTSKGRELFNHHKIRLKKELLEKFEQLQVEDVKKLNGLVLDMKEIFDKLE